MLPTADALAGATISWSGYARPGLVYESTDTEVKVDRRDSDTSDFEEIAQDSADDDNDLDVFARGQLRVKASTDTAVGEVGADLRIRANFDGVESEGEDFYMDVAWGYWAMTPELTFGGGYASSLGEVDYTFDAECTCDYIDTIGFDPGDTTQLRLSYASGPFSVGIALEDGSLENEFGKGSELDAWSGDQLGVAGEVKYSGDLFSAQFAGMWRGLEDDDDLTTFEEEFLPDSWWQVGGGVSFGVTDMATFNIGAAFGDGPVEVIDEVGTDVYANGVDFANPWGNSWWGVSGMVTVNLTDEFRAELGAGYISRDFDSVTAEVDFDLDTEDDVEDLGDADFTANSHSWVIGGGMYYQPVDQLTIGIEASYADVQADVEADGVDAGDPDVKIESDEQVVVVDFVGVWRF